MAALQEAIETNMIENKAIEDDSFSERQSSRYFVEPKCLLPDSVRHADGIGPAMDLAEFRGKLLVVTLGINTVVERTGLTISVWGSPDQGDWGAKPLVTLRQRQYCGVYSVLLNLAQRSDINFLRVQWNMTRWGKGERAAQFGFEVFLEESGARISTSVCA